MAGTYRINFNADGGSPTPSALTGATQEQVEVGGSTMYIATAKLPTTKPTKSGMSFASWSGYAAGANYNIRSTSSSYVTTLTARYSIQIGYDTNGGAESAKYQTVSPNVQFTLLSFYPTRTGYTFKGWSTDSSATTATYQSGGKATRSANTRLYAVWEANTYTVSFNANGGTGSPSAQTKTYGQTLTLSSTVPTRTNYNFLGWSTSNTATQPTYSAGGSYTANASATLYAVWELAIRTLTLSFNANGGSNPPSSLSVETAESAYSFQVPQQVVDTPYYDHHVFLGWSTEEDGAVEYAYPMSITIQQNTTLYAVWRLETFSISFNGNGGSNPPASLTKTYGQGIFLPLIAPTKDGYNFLGWDTSSAGNVVVYEAGDLYEEEESVVLYAVWQIKTYTVTYNANGGSDAPSAQTKTHNVSVVLSSARPIRASYVFAGWGTSADATTPSYQPNSQYTVNADATLYAIWKEATYDSADLFVGGEPCEVFIKLESKNLLPPMVDGTYSGNGVTAVVSGGIATLSGTTTSSGVAFNIPLTESFVIPSNSYYHMCNSVANASLAPSIELSTNISGTSISLSLSPINRVSAVNSNRYGVTVDRVRFYISNGVSISGTYSPMICMDNVASPYQPYLGADGEAIVGADVIMI